MASNYLVTLGFYRYIVGQENRALYGENQHTITTIHKYIIHFHIPFCFVEVINLVTCFTIFLWTTHALHCPAKWRLPVVHVGKTKPFKFTPDHSSKSQEVLFFMVVPFLTVIGFTCRRIFHVHRIGCPEHSDLQATLDYPEPAWG